MNATGVNKILSGSKMIHETDSFYILFIDIAGLR